MEDIVVEAANEAVANTAHKIKIEKLNETMDQMGIKDPVERLRAIRDSLESPAAVKRQIRPIEGNTHAMHAAEADFNQSMLRMAEHMEKINPSLRQIITQNLDSQLADDFILYMAGGKPKIENPEAAEFAKIWRAEVERYMQRNHEAGGVVTDIDDYVSQGAAPGKVLTAKDEYLQFLVDNMDRKFHKNPQAEAESIYRGIARELDDPDGATAIIKSMDRKLRLATPEAKLEYLKRFGEGTPMDQMTRNLHAWASKANLTEQWGPRPYLAIDTMVSDTLDAMTPEQKLANKVAGTPEVARLSRQVEIIKHQWEGRHNVTRNVNTAAVGSLMRHSFMSAFLGKVSLFSMTSDLALGAHNLSGVRRGVVAGSTAYNMAKLIGRAATTGSKTELGRMARSMGAFQHSIIGGMGARLGGLSVLEEGLTGGSKSVLHTMDKTMARIAQNNFLFQGADFLSNRLRAGQAIENMMAISEFAGKSFDDVKNSNPILAQRMIEAGFSDDFWSRISRPEYMADTHQMLDIDKIAKKDLEASRRLRVFLQRESTFSVQAPDAMARAQLRGAGITGTGQSAGRRGSLIGEGVLMMTQFQSAPLMIVRNNVTRSLREGRGRLPALMGGLGLMMAFKVQFDEVSNGREMWDWDDPLFHLKVFDATGLSWMAGSIAYQMAANSRVKGRAEIDFSSIGGPAKSVAKKATNGLFDVLGGTIDAGGLPSDEILDQAFQDFTSVMPWQNNLLVQVPFWLAFQKNFRQTLHDIDHSEFDMKLKDN
jgi:hypothetical protein